VIKNIFKDVTIYQDGELLTQFQLKDVGSEGKPYQDIYSAFDASSGCHVTSNFILLSFKHQFGKANEGKQMLFTSRGKYLKTLKLFSLLPRGCVSATICNIRDKFYLTSFLNGKSVWRVNKIEITQNGDVSLGQSLEFNLKPGKWWSVRTLALNGLLMIEATAGKVIGFSNDPQCVQSVWLFDPENSVFRQVMSEKVTSNKGSIILSEDVFGDSNGSDLTLTNLKSNEAFSVPISGNVSQKRNISIALSPIFTQIGNVFALITDSTEENSAHLSFIDMKDQNWIIDERQNSLGRNSYVTSLKASNEGLIWALVGYQNELAGEDLAQEPFHLLLCDLKESDKIFMSKHLYSCELEHISQAKLHISPGGFPVVVRGDYPNLLICKLSVNSL